MIGAICFAAQVIAAVLAVAIIWRSPRSSYRPVALFLCYVVVADAVRWLLLLITSGAPIPFEGCARIAFFVRESLYWGWMFGIVALAIRVYLERSPRFLIAAWVVAVLGLILSYPAITGAPLNWIRASLHAVEVLSVAGMFLMWLGRKPADVGPEMEHRATLLIAGADLVLFLGPYFPTSPDPAHRWALAQGSYTILYAFLIVLERGGLCSMQSRSRR